MASFYAELQVAGATYPVRSCTYEFTQATGARGRVVAKVRPGLVYVMLDVPRDEIIQLWAATAYKSLAGCLVCYDAQGGPALETLSWTEGHCVGYQEEFRSGNDEAGAYVCHLTIAAPTLTMQAGGPGSYRAPTPGAHGHPATALLNPFVVPLLTPTPVVAPLVEATVLTDGAGPGGAYSGFDASQHHLGRRARRPGIPQPHGLPVNRVLGCWCLGDNDWFPV